MDIQVVIKAPNQNIKDHTVHCNLDWSVGRLKDHLSHSYPNKPVVKDQKLIYSGRLLHDHLHLKEILRHDESQSPVHIFHLVCNSTASQDQHSYSSHNWSSQATPQPQISNDLNAGPSSENTVRNRNISLSPPTNTVYPQFHQGQSAPPSTNLPVFLPDSQVAAQIAAMQQMYAYYFTQYIQGINPTPDASSGPIFPDITNYEQQAAPNDIPVQRQGNQRINAQGGPILEENDDIGNRDWLDHLFLWCRFLILFCVVYFYSTPERLMIVIVCAIVAFLYHEGWFMRRTNPAAVPADVHIARGNPNNLDIPPDFENHENDPSLVNQDLSANDELQEEHQLEAAMDGDDPPHAQYPDVANNNNQIFSPLTFLTAFFSSLIPDPPPPVNIN